jgi:Hint domain
MPNLENLPSGIRRSRRNLVKLGAVAASAIFAGLMKTPAFAAPPPPPPPGPTPPGPPAPPPPGPPGPPNGPMCFLRGTRIRTCDGDKKIEELAVGDLLPNHFGGIQPIQWIGRYSYKRSDPTKPWVKDVLPVRVARSALGPNVPRADLYITRAHALLIDGVLVPVCNLINGTTITMYDPSMLDELGYFHIKLQRHDVIYAEGAPCETLLIVDENAVNFAEYLRQYGTPEIEDVRCAPWVGFGPRVEIKSRFRSAISPWIDCREKLDMIRDELEEGGIVLPQH